MDRSFADHPITATNGFGPGRAAKRIDRQWILAAPIDVPDQFVATIANRSHRVIHRDFVTHVAQHDFVPAGGMVVSQNRQEASSVQADISGRGPGPIENGGCDVGERDQRLGWSCLACLPAGCRTINGT